MSELEKRYEQAKSLLDRMQAAFYGEGFESEREVMEEIDSWLSFEKLEKDLVESGDL